MPGRAVVVEGDLPPAREPSRAASASRLEHRDPRRGGVPQEQLVELPTVNVQARGGRVGSHHRDRLGPPDDRAVRADKLSRLDCRSSPDEIEQR